MPGTSDSGFVAGETEDDVIKRLQEAATKQRDLFSLGALGEALAGAGRAKEGAAALAAALGGCPAPPETPAHLAAAYAHYCGAAASAARGAAGDPRFR